MDLTEYKDLFSEIFLAEDYSLKSKSSLEYFQNKSVKIGFCIGWQRLIPEDILNLFPLGIYGMHGSSRDLPFGRGRSPMNWSIIEGRSWFFTNLFKYDTGTDNGPIVDTTCFSISEADTAETLHYKNTLAMWDLIQKNIEQFNSGKVLTTQQNKGEGSFYPKRSPGDGLIDWRDDIINIDRLIRAVCYLNKKEIRIFRSSIFYTDIEEHPYKANKFGEILEVFPNKKFLVRACGGVILVNEYSKEPPLKPGMVFDINESTLKDFKRNKYGFFDN